jgi:hypothetical protein
MSDGPTREQVTTAGPHSAGAPSRNSAYLRFHRSSQGWQQECRANLTAFVGRPLRLAQLYVLSRTSVPTVGSHLW